MNLGEKSNRGLRHLVLESYLTTEPELVKLNIAKLQILNSISGDVLYLPDISGIPHDAAVQVFKPVLSQPIISQQQQLIWFDFVALLPDPAGQVSSSGTQTLETERCLSPAFYIVLFPKADDYVAIVPQHIAWNDRDCLSTDVSIPGPWLPYVMKVDQVEEALRRIAMVPWGQKYVNPGTEVVLGKWNPKIVTEMMVLPPPTQIPSPAVIAVDSRAGQKRRREDSPETWTSMLTPVTRLKTSRQPDTQLDIPRSLLHYNQQASFHMEDWKLLALSEEVLKNGPWPGYIPSDMDQERLTTASLGPDGLGYISTEPEDMSWAMTDSTGGQGSWLDALTASLEGSSQAGCLPSTQSMSTSLAARQTSLVEAITAPADSVSKPTVTTESFFDTDLGQHRRPTPTAPPRTSTTRPSEPPPTTPSLRLLELHPHHPFANHLYIPSPSETSPLLHLLTPSTPCLPILTTYTHLPSGHPTPLSRLTTTHPCLHILLPPSSPTTLHFLPSRILSSYTSHLSNLLQGTLNASRRKSTNPDSKRSSLRGKNKRRTERPEVGDVLEWAAGGRKIGLRELGLRLEEEFRRELAKGEGVVCTVREVLQAQVDGVWDVLG